MKRRAVVRPESREFMQKRHLRRPLPIEPRCEVWEAESKRPRMHGCPNCGLKHRLAELDLIPGCALGHFDKNGLWEFEGETKVFWDGQGQEHDPARFVCLNCDAIFDLSGRIY